MSSTTPARTPSPELSSAQLKSSPATATDGPPEPFHKSMFKKSKNQADEEEEEEEEGEPITPPATPKAKGNKRKAASSTTVKAEKATKKPRAEADDAAASANRGGWEPEHTALVQRMKAEGKSWAEIVGALKEIFGVDKKPKAVQMHFNRTQAKTFEWTEELVCILITANYEG
jgi:hypothetical protein